MNEEREEEKTATFKGSDVEIFMATIFFPTKNIILVDKYKRKLSDELLKFLLNIHVMWCMCEL